MPKHYNFRERTKEEKDGDVRRYYRTVFRLTHRANRKKSVRSVSKFENAGTWRDWMHRKHWHRVYLRALYPSTKKKGRPRACRN